MREKRKEKPTIDMCYYRDSESGNLCSDSPSWKVKGDKYRFKICDKHLAWGIRLSGLPALVDKYEPANPEKPHMFQEFNSPESHRDYSCKPTLVGKRPTPPPAKK